MEIVMKLKNTPRQAKTNHQDFVISILSVRHLERIERYIFETGIPLRVSKQLVSLRLLFISVYNH